MRNFFRKIYNVVKGKQIIIFLVSLSGIWLCFFYRLSLYALEAGSCLCFMLYFYLVYQRRDKRETGFLVQMGEFFSGVRIFYGYHGILEDAVLDAIDMSKDAFYYHGDMLYKMLEEEEENTAYFQETGSRIWEDFFHLCKMVQFHGDVETKEGSAFLTCLSYLKEDLEEELLQRKKASALFSGLFPVIIMPFFSIPFIERWAIGNMKELSEYYSGTVGLCSGILILFVTIFVYWLTNRMHYGSRSIRLVPEIFIRIAKHPAVKNVLNRKLYRQESYYTRLFRYEKHYGRMLHCLGFMVSQCVYACLAGILWIVNFYGRFSFLLTCLGGACMALLGYIMPYVPLFFFKQESRMRKEEEIMRCQFSLLFLRHVPGISVEEMLEWLNEASDFFEEEWNELILIYYHQGMEGLAEWRTREEFPPLNRILDSLLACDNLPVREAFARLESDRTYDVKKLHQEQEAMLKDKAVVARTAAFLPMYLIVACKLVLPFVYEGLSQLGVYTQSMQNFYMTP